MYDVVAHKETTTSSGSPLSSTEDRCNTNTLSNKQVLGGDIHDGVCYSYMGVNPYEFTTASFDFKDQTDIKPAPPKKIEEPYVTIDKEKLAPLSEDVHPEPG